MLFYEFGNDDALPVNVSFLLSFQFGAFCFPFLPFFWMALDGYPYGLALLSNLDIRGEHIFFISLHIFFFVVCFMRRFCVYIYTLSWRRFLMECVAFCVIL